MTAAPEMKINRLVPWFGANGAEAERPAALLKGCSYVYIPFAGSMCEVPHFPASTQIMVSDLHDELICLAGIVADQNLKNELAERLDAKLFHPTVLDAAKTLLALARRRGGGDSGLFNDSPASRSIEPPLDSMTIAEAYFVVAWMGRSAVAGTRGEERTSLALRYDGGGGDPVTRYRSAVSSLEAWHQVLKRCSFTREDAFAVIARLAAKPHDPKKPIGLYCDPPWPDDGAGYLHTFIDAQQRRLAGELAALPHRVVVRYGDHPLIRELYPQRLGWQWIDVTGKTQHNDVKAEVLLVKEARAGA